MNFVKRKGKYQVVVNNFEQLKWISIKAMVMFKDSPWVDHDKLYWLVSGPWQSIY